MPREGEHRWIRCLVFQVDPVHACELLRGEADALQICVLGRQAPAWPSDTDRSESTQQRVRSQEGRAPALHSMSPRALYQRLTRLHADRLGCKLKDQVVQIFAPHCSAGCGSAGSWLETGGVRMLGLRARSAVVGIGESEYARHGQASASEFELTLRAILASVEDAGLTVDDVDGFVSYGDDKNEPIRLASALGIPELKLAACQWGGGGGGSAGHIALAAAGIAAGLADCVVVFKASAQGQHGRLGLGRGSYGAGEESVGYNLGGAASAPYGLFSPPQKYALRATRMMEVGGVPRSAMRAVARAAYHHARNNPNAVFASKSLSDAEYDESRWIAEPLHLYDCCQESDAAAAMILVAADRARQLRHDPVYVLAAGQGGEFRAGAGAENMAHYDTAGASLLAPRLYSEAGVRPADVNVAQIYDNFTVGVILSMIDHGLCTYENVSEVVSFDNLIAPNGAMPINTSGGNFAEVYILGMSLHLEAVRQLRGSARNQVPGAEICLSTGGPMTALTSSAIFGSSNTV